MVRFRDDDDQRVYFNWFIDDEQVDADDITNSSQVMNGIVVYDSILKVRRTSPPPTSIRCLATDALSVTRLTWTVVTP